MTSELRVADGRLGILVDESVEFGKTDPADGGDFVVIKVKLVGMASPVTKIVVAKTSGNVIDIAELKVVRRESGTNLLATLAYGSIKSRLPIVNMATSRNIPEATVVDLGSSLLKKQLWPIVRTTIQPNEDDTERNSVVGRRIIKGGAAAAIVEPGAVEAVFLPELVVVH